MPSVWIYGCVYMSKRVGSNLVEARASIYVDGHKLDVNGSSVERIVLEDRVRFKKEIRVVFEGLGLKQEYVFVPHKRKEWYLVEFPFVEDLTLRIVLRGRIREKYSRIEPDRFITGLLSGDWLETSK